MTQHDSLTDDMKTTAQELGQDAKNAIRSEAEKATETVRDRAVDEATRAANAADAAASEFGADSIQARAAQQVADQVEGLANQLRHKDLNTLTRDVSNFARNNPALFIGGAALLGFAATRFLKARDPQRVDYDAERSDPWGTQATAHPASRGYDVPS